MHDEACKCLHVKHHGLHVQRSLLAGMGFLTVPCPCNQASVSRARVESFSLVADMMYMATNAPRILRAVFEIALRSVINPGFLASAICFSGELARFVPC